jgi:integrative and conjugative element protein (TIGR02256 family)
MGKPELPSMLKGGDRMKRIYQFNTRPGSFSFAPEAFIKIHAHRQTDDHRAEAGGVLIGRKIKDSEDWIVDDVTEPQNTDRRKRFSFFRSKDPHQSAVDKAWSQSQGRIGYMGEWHTHPERHPTPSATDLSHWRKALATFRFDGELLFFAIVGTESVAVFEGNKKYQSIEQLKSPK